MGIGAFAVNDFSEEPVLCHIQAGELEAVVAAVLEHHAVTLGALRGVHKVPALLDGSGGGHLDGHVLAMLHSIHRDGSMELPGNGEVDEVDVVPFAEFLVAFLTGEFIEGTRCAKLLDDALGTVDAVLMEVAQGNDARILDKGQTPHGAGSAVTQADEADPHMLDGVALETQHGLLVGGTGRSVVYNLIVLDCVAVFVAGAGNGQDGCNSRCK